MIKKDCFAYYEDVLLFIDEDYKSTTKGCKALTQLLCKKRECPFYKKKGTEKEVIFNAPRVKNTY